jgi:hypothetical protein
LFASKRQATESTRRPPSDAPGPASATLDTPAFRANQAALRGTQPELAERLHRVKLPPSARIAAGRDGSPVAILAEDASRVTWLGGSSMPSVSGPIAVEHYNVPHAGVVLLGIGTGYEPRYLAGRLARHYAVIVSEPDLARLALGLAASDLSDLIGSRRVLLLDGDIETSLPVFLREHADLECPGQLFSLPGLDADTVAARSAAVQRAVTAVQLERSRIIEQMAGEMNARPRDYNLESPRVLVVATRPDDDATTQVEAVCRSLQDMHLPFASSAPETPAGCSRLARLAAVRDLDPDLLLFVNCTPGELAGRVAADLPYACWFLESCRLPVRALDGIESCPIIAAASSPVRDELLARGARPETITIVEPGLDEVLFEPAPADGPDQEVPAVVMFADLENLTPQAVGITLQTQAKLWQRLVELVTAEVDRYQPRRMEDWLKRAERQADVRLTDAEQRDHLRGLAAVLMPKTLLAVRAAQSLAGAAIDVGLWGRNAAAYDALPAIHRGPVPVADPRRRILQRAAVVVIPCPDADGCRQAREALAAGACPLIRCIDEELAERYPQTGALLASLPQYGTAKELITRCQALLGDNVRRRDIIESARSELLAGHTVKQRLHALLDLVRCNRP